MAAVHGTEAAQRGLLRVLRGAARWCTTSAVTGAARHGTATCRRHGPRRAAHERASRQGRTAWSTRGSGRSGERRVARRVAWHGIAQAAGPGGDVGLR
ncbi:hypothetical protein E2562_008570 [Oryza meyeriana var. granulata]|uniref:Uncharacterized protein n=1 Tax=Oryza meyeriana var. granulata TaxID=110450 RepID=A0A6G1C4Y9_9ORYZ|nr:hypothetical protein E2562_008570 [Oryza meyeriana var. granulata]